jgi:hypothetical protein
MIVDGVGFIRSAPRDMWIENVEEEQRFDQILVKRIADIIGVLPNLEM